MKKFSVLALVLMALSFLLVPLPAHAAGEIAALFAAVDLSPVTIGVVALLTGFVGIRLIIVAYGYVRLALSKR